MICQNLRIVGVPNPQLIIQISKPAGKIIGPSCIVPSIAINLALVHQGKFSVFILNMFKRDVQTG